MNKGRKDLRQLGIGKVVSLRGSNQIEVMNVKRHKSLALFPAKFLRVMFISRGITQQEKRRRRRRRRIQRRGRDMCYIPLDLLIEILIRLPPKSLTRFKCVSRQWSSLISCRHFCDRLFTVTRQQQQPCMYMCLVKKGGPRMMLSISSASPENTCFVVDQDLSISGMGGYFLNVVRGLMCFSVRKKACIYNPTTRQRLTLPAIGSNITAGQGQVKDTSYYIGYDPVNDQYKVLCTVSVSSDFICNLESEHWVFVIEAGGSWKKLFPSGRYYYSHDPSVGQIINGPVIHYMAWVNMFTCAVVSFDVRSEELTTLVVPLEAGDGLDVPCYQMKAGLIEYSGKITVFDYTHIEDECLVDLWIVVDSTTTEEGWSKERLVLQPSQRHLVHDIKLALRGTTQDGKVILSPVGMRSEFYLLCYDMQRNDLRKVEIKGIPDFWFGQVCYCDFRFVDESEGERVTTYLET